MRINNNLMALNTQRQLNVNNNNTSKSVEKLSSGFRINRAGDDAAGLAISEKMRSQIRGLNMASRNSQDAISLVQTAEGALTETHAILQRMRELAVQSSSDTNQNLVDREAMSEEFNQLKGELNDIAGNTKFNNMKLLDGNFGGGITVSGGTTSTTAGVAGITTSGSAEAGTYTFTLDSGNLSISDGTGTTVDVGAVAGMGNAGTINIDRFGISITTAHGFDAADLDAKTIVLSASGGGGVIQTGANAGEEMTISIGAMDATSLGIDGSVSIAARSDASSALSVVDTAINSVSKQRSELGAIQNRLEHKINNLNTSSENLQAAESRIRDVDMAKEMMEYTKNNILSQAATAMLAQANNAPQSVLRLLQ